MTTTTDTTEYKLTTTPTKTLAQYLTEHVSADADAPHRGLPFIDAKDNVRVKPDHFEQWFVSSDTHDGTPTTREVRGVLRDAKLVQRVYPLPANDAHPKLKGKSFGLYTGPAPAGTAKLPRRVVERKAPAKAEATTNAKAALAKVSAKGTQAEPTTEPAADGPTRIAAGDIQPGDRVARARTAEFREVAEIHPGTTAVRLLYTGGGGNDRPRKTAKWWKA